MKKFQQNDSLEKNIKKNEFVLDVGCWSGNRVNNLLKKCQPYGLDIDSDKLNLAPKKIKKRLFSGDITRKDTLKKINRKFDWIFLGEVLEHIKEDEIALKNINFLLKKDGKLVLTTPKSIPFFEFWDPAWIRWKLHLGQRHHHYTKKELFDKLERNGFVIRRIRLMGNIKWLFFRWVNTFLKNIFKSKKACSFSSNEGFFDWEIFAIKK